MSWRSDSGSTDAGEEKPKVVVRDKRRIDPVTGQIRVPSGGEQPTGADPAGGHPTAGPAGGQPAAGPAGGVQVEEATTGDTVEVAADELAALRSQLEERTGDLQRVTAEYSNYRRRVERDRQAVVASAKAQVAGELLTVLDDIERAEAHGDLSGAFKVVADKLVAGLTTQGLESFGATGVEFDPEVHEAVQHSTSPDVQGPTVTAVLRRGYRFGERVLRPAMVAVTDAEPSTEPSTGPGAASSTGPGAASSTGPDTMSRDAARSVPGTAAPGDSDGSAGPGAGGLFDGNGGPPGGPEPGQEY